MTEFEVRVALANWPEVTNAWDKYIKNAATPYPGKNHSPNEVRMFFNTGKDLVHNKYGDEGLPIFYATFLKMRDITVGTVSDWW